MHAQWIYDACFQKPLLQTRCLAWQSLPRGGGGWGIVGLVGFFVCSSFFVFCLKVPTIIALFLAAEGVVAVSACPAGNGMGVLWLSQLLSQAVQGAEPLLAVPAKWKRRGSTCIKSVDLGKFTALL